MIPCGRLYFVVDTLEYLAKGGRIGGAKKLLAELLSDQADPAGQGWAGGAVRTASDEETGAGPSHGGGSGINARADEDAHLCVLQVAAEKEAEALVEELKANIPVSEIPVYQLPPAIVVHAGPKAMGLGFFVK
jgi:fatty acid-binding protein DegV